MDQFGRGHLNFIGMQYTRSPLVNAYTTSPPQTFAMPRNVVSGPGPGPGARPVPGPVVGQGPGPSPSAASSSGPGSSQSAAKKRKPNASISGKSATGSDVTGTSGTGIGSGTVSTSASVASGLSALGGPTDSSTSSLGNGHHDTPKAGSASGTAPGSVAGAAEGNGTGTGNGEKTESKKRPQSCDVCRARKVKCVKQPGQPRCEGCVSLDQRCEYTHERKKPGPANSYARKPSPSRQFSSNQTAQQAAAASLAAAQPSLTVLNQPLNLPLGTHTSPGFPHPHHVRSYSHGATPNFDMPPPRWTPPINTLNLAPPSTSSQANQNLLSTFLPTASTSAGGSANVGASNMAFGIPPSAAQIAASAGLNLDPSFLPISPQSLLHPQPGEPDTASEDSPMGRWPWMQGMEDFWDPRSDPILSELTGPPGSAIGGLSNQTSGLFGTGSIGMPAAGGHAGLDMNLTGATMTASAGPSSMAGIGGMGASSGGGMSSSEILNHPGPSSGASRGAEDPFPRPHSNPEREKDRMRYDAAAFHGAGNQAFSGNVQSMAGSSTSAGGGGMIMPQQQSAGLQPQGQQAHLAQQNQSMNQGFSGSAGGGGASGMTGVDRASLSMGIPPRVSRIEDVAPLSTITRILHGYHAHLYSLMPIVHWPTFSQQLISREDERSETWRAFLLSLVAYSIIQLPRSALAFLPVRDLRKLHQRCHAESRRLQNRAYREIRVLDIATLYCDHIYLGTLGKTHLGNVLLAEAIRLAQALNLHDERLGDAIPDVIEKETRRRVFWLLYGSDRTITALTSVPMHIQDCDLCLPLPMAIDDALLTTAGAFPQPPNTTPLLAGFHFNCRLYRLLGAVQTAHRQLICSSAHPTTDPFPMLHLPPAPIHIRPSTDFVDELDRILADLPGPLQLVNPTNTPGTVLTTASSGSGTEARDSGFATCRANLLISQAMVRFAIRQYAKAACEDEAEGKDWAERDVLQLLESMSSESLAANGESLRRKVLFVASSLLEKYPSSAEGHSYVADFLAVYTRISEEQHAALLEESAAPSRETTPARGGINGMGRPLMMTADSA